MKNKMILAALFLFLIGNPIYSQERTECKNIAEKTFQAIDSHSPEILFPHLAENFTISGHTGKIAKSVLQQLISQLAINSYEVQEIITNENTSKLIYSVDYNGLGKKQSVFTFNENCELETLELFKMEVKVLNEGETKIDKPSDTVIKIPFEMARNLIAVKVLLNGQERTFLFDSGSPRVTLNSKYFSTEEQQTSISSAKGVTDNNISGLDIQKVKNLNFGGIQINNQKVVSTNLAHLEESLDIDIYGLIGYEMIKDFDLYFDYGNQTLTLISPDFFESFRKSDLSNKKIVSVPIQMRGHIPVIEVIIEGEKLNFGIDSGAEANLIEDKLYPNFKKYLKNGETDNLLGADKNSVEIKSGNLKRMALNGKAFKGLKTVFTNIDHLNKNKEIKIQGLIGYPILSKQKTIISFNREEILFVE